MTIDFNKENGLVPAIIQDFTTNQVLMLGYMNEDAFEKTRTERVVTFFSRSKGRLWTKGETSGNYLNVQSISLDCDNDTLLIKVLPEGVVCHRGTQSCFGNKESKGFLYELERTINNRIDQKSSASYTYSLYTNGINKIAQKVGEEAVELVIEAKDSDDELFKNEAADLLYHLLILLKAKSMTLSEVEGVLLRRHEKNP